MKICPSDSIGDRLESYSISIKRSITGPLLKKKIGQWATYAAATGAALASSTSSDAANFLDRQPCYRKRRQRDQRNLGANRLRSFASSSG